MSQKRKATALDWASTVVKKTVGSFFALGEAEKDKLVNPKLVQYDDNGDPLNVPLILTQDEELRLFGAEAFSQNFCNVTSLIASPGQGKSRLATALYNIMRETNEPYFKMSNGSVSYTKGVWRLSDNHKQMLLSKDAIDVLDVEGLQMENTVYYLLIAAIILSQSIVLLSRERVNKEALGVLNIAFKMLDQLDIVLKKPVVFIQTKVDDDGNLLDENERPVTRASLMKSIKLEIPVIDKFQVEFFSLTEVPDLKVLKKSTRNLPASVVESIFENANELYYDDVRALLERLKKVEDDVNAETRMSYLNVALEHLNNNNPDLVLELNLEFFEKDAKRWLDTAVAQQREKIISHHRTKPLGEATTLEQFFQQPDESIEEIFYVYCESESPFVGQTKDIDAFKAKAKQVYETSSYFSFDLKAMDPATSKCIGIMSYVQPDFEAKRKTSSDLLNHVFSTLKTEFESSGYDMFGNSDIPDNPPSFCVKKVKTFHTNVTGLDAIIDERWKQVRIALETRKLTLLSESKWVKKCRTEGSDTCKKCNKEHNDYISHKNCINELGADRAFWYWIKNSSKYAICSGCEATHKVERTGFCSKCDSSMQSKVIPPDW